MDPLAVAVPERLIGDDAFITRCPALRPLWINCQRLFRLVVLLAQLTQAEAADDVPCALNPRYSSPHAPRCGLSVGHRSEKRPTDVNLRRPYEVGAASAERVPATLTAVVRGAHVIP